MTLVRPKGLIDVFELKAMLLETRRAFPLLEGWRIDIWFGRIRPYALVEISDRWDGRRLDHAAIIKINPTLRDSLTRTACLGLIAHELMHCEFRQRGMAHTEEMVAGELLRRGYQPSLNALFFCICTEPCHGRFKKVVGGADCQFYCPHGIVSPRPGRRVGVLRAGRRGVGT